MKDISSMNFQNFHDSFLGLTRLNNQTKILGKKRIVDELPKKLTQDSFEPGWLCFFMVTGFFTVFGFGTRVARFPVSIFRGRIPSWFRTFSLMRFLGIVSIGRFVLFFGAIILSRSILSWSAVVISFTPVMPVVFSTFSMVILGSGMRAIFRRFVLAEVIGQNS